MVTATRKLCRCALFLQIIYLANAAAANSGGLFPEVKTNQEYIEVV
jgi:hypothetical protein